MSDKDSSEVPAGSSPKEFAIASISSKDSSIMFLLGTGLKSDVGGFGGGFGGISTRSWTTLGEVILFFICDLCLLTDGFLCPDVRCFSTCLDLTPCFCRKSAESGKGEPGLLCWFGGRPSKDLGLEDVEGGMEDSEEFPLGLDRMVEEDLDESVLWSVGFELMVCVDVDEEGGEHWMATETDIGW